jgi:hypothetical protein
MGRISRLLMPADALAEREQSARYKYGTHRHTPAQTASAATLRLACSHLSSSKRFINP